MAFLGLLSWLSFWEDFFLDLDDWLSDELEKEELDRLEELSEELVTSESFYTSDSNSETQTHPNISIVDETVEDGENRRISRRASKMVPFGIP